MPHRVLVIDDEEGVRSLLTDALVRPGVEVYTAVHGEEGVDMFERVAPHLVVLDFLVPKKNGFGVAEAIRATAYGAKTPIIMMSGVFKNPKTAVEAREKYQVLEFLSKPLDLERIERLVSEALQGVPADAGPAGRDVSSGPEASEAPTPPPALHPTRSGSSRPRRPAMSGSQAAARRGAEEGERPSVVDGVIVGNPLPAVEDEGDIERSPVPQLLSALLLDRATGMLDLIGSSVHRRIYLIDGRPTFMQSNAEGENVGVLLLRRGRVTEQDFQRCRQYMQERRRTLQQSLLDLKLVNEVELATAYKLLAGQLLPMAMGMPVGRYRWRATDAFVGRVPEGKFDPLDVIFRGIADNVHPPRIFSFFSGRENLPIYRTALWEKRWPAFTRVFSSAEALTDRIDGSQTFRVLSKARQLEASTSLLQLFALVTSGMAAPSPDEDGLGLEAAVHAAADEARYSDDDEPREGDLEGSESGGNPEDMRARAKVERYHEDVMSRDFFEIFGVDDKADVDTIKSAYFELAKRWHVDAFAGVDLGRAKSKLEEVFNRITEAYDTISDPHAREDYLVYLDRKRKGLPTDVSEILRGEQLFDQAAAMIRRKDWSGAREVLEEAVRLNHDPIYFATLGWTIHNESPEDHRARLAAVGHIKRGLREQENLPIAYQYLGAIAFRRNQYAEAEKWWRRCLEWEPNNVEASRGLRVIAQRSSSDRRGKSLLGRLRGRKS